MSVFIVRAKLDQKFPLIGNNIYAFPSKEDALSFIADLANFDSTEYEWIECLKGKIKGSRVVAMEEKK